MQYARIKEHRTEFQVAVMCRVVDFCRSAFYTGPKVRVHAREQRQEAIVEQIKAICQEPFMGQYGSPCMFKELNARVTTVSRNTVAKVMKQGDLLSEIKPRFVPTTTESNHDHPIAPNNLTRDFNAIGPNQNWLCDITSIRTDEGWLYLTDSMVCFSRKIVGRVGLACTWCMHTKMPAELVCAVLSMAIARRQPGEGLLHHRNRGVQYASDQYQQLLGEHRNSRSMSRDGNCYDDAMKESFWSSLKREEINGRRFKTIEEARALVFDYIRVFYNRKRRHNSLGYISPESFEASQNQGTSRVSAVRGEGQPTCCMRCPCLSSYADCQR